MSCVAKHWSCAVCVFSAHGACNHKARMSTGWQRATVLHSLKQVGSRFWASHVSLSSQRVTPRCESRTIIRMWSIVSAFHVSYVSRHTLVSLTGAPALIAAAAGALRPPRLRRRRARATGSRAGERPSSGPGMVVERPRLLPRAASASNTSAICSCSAAAPSRKSPCAPPCSSPAAVPAHLLESVLAVLQSSDAMLDGAVVGQEVTRGAAARGRRKGRRRANKYSLATEPSWPWALARPWAAPRSQPCSCWLHRDHHCCCYRRRHHHGCHPSGLVALERRLRAAPSRSPPG